MTTKKQLVKDIMLLEENEEFKLYGKTGMGSCDGVWYGLFVGWMEKNDNVYFFATNMESDNYKNLMTGGRKGITFAILEDYFH